MIHIDKDDLRLLILIGYTGTEIARIYKCNEATITRRKVKYSLRDLSPNKQYRKTTLQYKAEIKNKTIRCIDNYKIESFPIKHQCLICSSIWTVSPHDVLQGNGCPTCAKITAKLTYDTDYNIKEEAIKIPFFIYVLENELCLKIGVSKNPVNRVRTIGNNFSIIKVFGTTLWDAHVIETKVLANFNKYNYPIHFNGHTECKHKEDLQDIIKYIEGLI